MNTEAKDTNVEIKSVIELLDAKATNVQIIEKLNQVIEHVNKLPTRDRGPKSEHSMTEELAKKVLMEEPYCNMSHKAAAKQLKISYGQVSSVRGGYTFKRQYQEWLKAGGKKTWSRDYVEQS